MYDIIKSNPIFDGVSEEQLKKIFKKIHYRIIKYSKGESVFTESNFKSSMGIILSGMVEAQKLHYSGKVIILNRMAKGEVLGISALFNNKSYYPSRLVAKNNCKILFISQEELIKIFEMDFNILQRYLSFISDKIYFLNKRIEGFTYESIYERVLCFLENERERQNNQDEIIIKYSKQELAEYLCISRASLYRVLNELAKEGLIKWEKNKIRYL
ncbi:Crp/Fnr family transcriptional regulator [Paramaledivibacter caminithermalis]|jgi:CRP-like cAMP-binding protein|uniref:cAMP-binding domain of CRP or a regulatory subunit of cAMP-dependent protein kinases n=1 Tax=Paramaledivibacter caminithermalis (strain DSM 15212 / CIP 107654 / DViRD3) TaxID=1121301 RepID=A0A1M6P285_PARC5|nr:Crp/Fnr family transcriptional regulator [Paramaledivibacter caminithermalis]SHK02046.1 cAMP-binding domain of CRP or a regulatory subunit of cAMP-dependent protein kinases [Paramaledivibacter caminithermalis DSM 15212]